MYIVHSSLYIAATRLLRMLGGAFCPQAFFTLHSDIVWRTTSATDLKGQFLPRRFYFALLSYIFSTTCIYQDFPRNWQFYLEG